MSLLSEEDREVLERHYARSNRARELAAEVNKEYGAGAVMVATEMYIPKRFTSGSLSLDVSLGGGWPGNQWVEIYGPESHGKTAITLKTIAANQAIDPGFTTLWVASEHYDRDQAKALGVDTDRVFVLDTRDMAFAYDKICEWLEERAVDCVVLDSYPALIPPEEDEKDMDEYTMAEGAKMTNKFFRKVGKAGLRDASDPDDRPWLGIFINQPRMAMTRTMPGMPPPITTPGGQGKNFSFYARLEVKRAEWIFEGGAKNGVKVGQVIRTKAIKNKGGPPQRVASLDFYFTEAKALGFKRGEYDIPKDVLTMAVLFGVVKRAGAWYRYGEEKWQGLKDMLADLRKRPDLLRDIEAKTREVAERPEDKRTWDEDDVVAAQTATTTVRRRKKRDSDATD